MSESALGSALSAGANIYGSVLSSKSAKKSAAIQYMWELMKAKNQIQWSVKDALKAGINPAVAVNTSNSAGSINPPMPDTKGFTSAGQAIQKGIDQALADRQITAQEGVAESEIDKNTSEARKAEIDAGLKPRETAVKEMNAETQRQAVFKQSQMIDAQIDKINKLLPGEMRGQTYELAVKAAESRLTKREMEVLDNTGLTLSEWKGLGENILGVVKDIGRLKYGTQLLNATKPTRTTHDNYNGAGELTGFRVDNYFYK